MAYACQINPDFQVKSFWLMDNDDTVASGSRIHAETVINHYIDHAEYCEGIIAKYLGDSWTMDRIGFFEKGLISCAIVEYLYMKTPIYAVLEEYVTVSTNFCDTKDVSFINSILNKILKDFEQSNEQNS